MKFNSYSFLLVITMFFTIGGTAIAQRAISLTPEKADALYIGVDNPVQVAVEGIADDKVYLASDGVEIENLGGGLYNLRVAHPGKTTFTVHGEGFDYKNFDLEVKRIPDPLAALKLEGGELKMDGELTPEQFRKAIGVGFEMKGFKGKIQLDLASFNIVRVPGDGSDPLEIANRDASFNERARVLVNAAMPGDRYYFQEVMVNAPNESEPRKVNSLVFRIK